MVYYYKSPIGLMRIYYDSTVHKVALEIAGTIYGHYNSAVSAADDVYTHTTGCYEWDKLDGTVTSPMDLSEWMKI